MVLSEELLGLETLLTPEQLQWQARARAAASTLAVTIDADAEARVFRREYVTALGAAGLLGMHIQGYGCAGVDAVSYGIACYELEAVDSSWRTFVSVQGSLAMSAIAKYGSEEQKQRWLPRMAAGELIGCFALTEPAGGSDPAAMTTSARRDGDEWVLDGAKRWIGLASVADVAVLWARTDDGIRGFLVPTDTKGFSAIAIDGKLSLRASVQCDVVLDGVRLPADAMLPHALGLSAPFSCLTEARFGIVWGVLGAARTCLDAAVLRSTTREVFGGPIGGKQLVQQRLAEAFLEYEKGMLLALRSPFGRCRATPARVSKDV